jgi:hypothetical protein
MSVTAKDSIDLQHPRRKKTVKKTAFAVIAFIALSVVGVQESQPNPQLRNQQPQPAAAPRHFRMNKWPCSAKTFARSRSSSSLRI